MSMQSPLARATMPYIASAPHTDDEAGQLSDDAPIAFDVGVIEHAFEYSHDCIALVDMQGMIVYMNLPGSYLMGLDGCPPQRRVSWSELWSSDNHGLAEYCIDEVRSGHPCRFIACRRSANGLRRWWDIAANPILDTRGAPSQMFCVCRDVTGLKQSERSLQQQVATKQVLLLQAVASIHRHLEPGRSHEQWELGSRMTEVVRETVVALAAENRIAVTTSCPQGLTMPIDRAVALLLVTTELLTNCLRHAYPHHATGSVHITVTGTKRQLQLQVDDDGQGLPVDFDAGSAGIGVRMIQALIAQLGGDFEIEPQPKGAHFRIRLPRDAPTEVRRGLDWDRHRAM